MLWTCYLENNIEDVTEQESNENHQKQYVDVFGLEPVSMIFDNVCQKHLEFLLHVLDNVVDGKDKEEGGDGDADVGEDENTRHFYLWNLPSGKYQRIIRCGILLKKKKHFYTFSTFFCT